MGINLYVFWVFDLKYFCMDPTKKDVSTAILDSKKAPNKLLVRGV